MNYIEVKRIKTCYDYPEHYWVVDGTPITFYLDRHRPSGYSSLLGLMPAWNGELLSQWENDFVWEMIDSQEALNVPILVCEDDQDLSCIVIMAHIRKENTVVHWDKIGVLDHSNFDLQEYNQSGILCLEAYSNQDWELYGSNIALEQYGSPEYWEWVNNNCYEEHIRRLRNYMKPYMQEETNIEWLWFCNWTFAAGNYAAVVEYYRDLKQQAKC